MAIVTVLISLLILIVLISIFKINPVLAFLIISILGGILLGIPANKVIASIQKGMGDTLGGLVFIIGLGAMIGKLIAESGAGQKIAEVMMQFFGQKYIQWALIVTGFIIGIPLFYGVGFVLVIPIIFSVVYKYKLPAVYIGLPMLAALSVTFGFLPPHPSPTALVLQFHANMGITLFYGILISIPAIIIAGPLLASQLKNIRSEPLQIFAKDYKTDNPLPTSFEAFFTAVLPVVLLMSTAIISPFLNTKSVSFKIISFIGDPVVVMLIALSAGTWLLGLNKGRSMKNIMDIYADAIKDIGIILLIIGSAGSFKQILIDSGVSLSIGESLKRININPLILSWIIAATIRFCVGSATVAGLTSAGIVAPLILTSGVNPNLLVLAIGAGSLAFSHVNDSGFWLFKEYFNLSLKDTLRSWTLMETIIAIVGLLGVLLLNLII